MSSIATKLRSSNNATKIPDNLMPDEIDDPLCCLRQ